LKLSVAILAFNSASYVGTLLHAAKHFADELVVGVDTSSSDATEQICGEYADKLFRLEPIGSSERALAWLNEQCTSDWIFRLDDDELPSTALIRALPDLLRDREYTHYALPRRWIIDDSQSSWIGQHPWWPDWQIRLFRNIRSLLTYPGHLHSECLVQGAGGYVPEGSLYHYTLVYHSEKRRQERLQQYEQISPNNSTPHFYFPREAAVVTRPIPADDTPFRGHPGSVWPNTASRGQRARLRRVFGGPLTRTPYVTLNEMDGARRETRHYPPEMFLAMVECLYCPEVTQPGRMFPVELQIHNDSPLVWRSVGLGNPTVTLSYHLIDATGQVYEYEGIRTNLPVTLRPGASVKVIAQVAAPWEQGDYRIRWDPIIEYVSWFSTHGWQGPETEFCVRAGPEAGAELEMLAPYLQMSQRIHGWFRCEEAEALARASYSLHGNPVIVEIGCFLGSSSVLLAGPRKVRGAGKVYCIDPFDGSGDEHSVPVYRHILGSLGAGSVRQHFDSNIRTAKLSEWVEARQGVASEISKDWTLPVDLLVLDGDQSRAGARAAYDSWSRFLRPGGIIALHNSNDRVYGPYHNGHRLLAVEELTSPRYEEVRLVGTTTFAVKTNAS
jgi:MMP 1-O-methyltransferase